PHPAMGMDYVRSDPPNLPRQTPRDEHGKAGHWNRLMQRRELIEALREATEVPQDKHVRLESRRIKPANDIGKESLHASVVEVLDHMQNPHPVLHSPRLRRCFHR